MATFRLLRPADYRAMPWKNGGGTTTQIAVKPRASAGVAGAVVDPLDTFAWRVSIADLTGAGPFSRFPGCARVILQLAGAPMILRHPKRGVAVQLAPLRPYWFHGDWETHGDLTSPSARDLNVMTRDDCGAADVQVLTLRGPGALGLDWRTDTLLLHCFQGTTLLRAERPDEFQIAAGETMLVEPKPADACTSGTLHADAAPGDVATVVVVRFIACHKEETDKIDNMGRRPPLGFKSEE
jgi:environmental stress-induced protein Ves